MKKTTALLTFTLLISLSSGAMAGETGRHFGASAGLALVSPVQAPPQAASPQWKSRDEYDAFNAMATEKDPEKKIQLAEAFLQKYPNSDFKDSAYLVEMQTYQGLNQMDKALDAAHKVVQANPNSGAALQALRALSFTFPFLYKTTDTDHDAQLSRADSDAHHGLDVVQKFQKPQGATEEQFQQAVKDLRSVFNSCIGFVALQKKDYANAINSLKAATADNPNSWYGIYWMSLAYLYSTPPDYSDAVWYGARAVDLAKAGKDPNADGWETFLKQTYVHYHGTDTGLSDILTQAATAANPPDGFKVGPLEAPKETGNKMTDLYNELTFKLKLGGEGAQNQWDAIKGQQVGLGGTVAGVEKSTADPNIYLVHISILDSTKSTDGYDIELKDSTQPNVKNLQKGDLLTFNGKCDSYVATPSLIPTLVGEVTSDLPDKPAAKPKTPVHHTTQKPPNN